MLGVFRDARLQELLTEEETMLRCPSSPASLFPSLLASGMKYFPMQETEAMGLCDTSKATSCNEDAASHRLSG